MSQHGAGSRLQNWYLVVLGSGMKGSNAFSLNMRKLLVTGKMRLSVIWFLGEDARNAVAFGDWFCECGVPTHTQLHYTFPRWLHSC